MERKSFLMNTQAIETRSVAMWFKENDIHRMFTDEREVLEWPQGKGIREPVVRGSNP